MQNLNNVISEYQPNSATEFDNNLVLHWYPQRIISRTGYVNSLLELGLGHGVTAQIFAKNCKEQVIVDGSSAVIDMFVRTFPRFAGELVLDYFETFESESTFDVIVMGFILEHVDDPDLILRRYRQFLKPGGKLYVAVPNAKSLNRRMGLAMGLINDIYALNENDLALGHQRQYCLETLRQTMKSAGYFVSHEEGIYLKPLPISILKTLPNLQENLNAMMAVGVDFPELCVGILIEARVDASIEISTNTSCVSEML